MKKRLFSLFLMLALALGLCVSASAFDVMNPPEPGAADGFVMTEETWNSTNMLAGQHTTKSSYTFDQNGRVLTRTDVLTDSNLPGQTTTETYNYTYDDQGRLSTTARSDGNHLMLYTYNADGTHYLTYSWIDDDGQHRSNERTYDPCEGWYWFGKWHFQFDEYGNTVRRWTDDGESWTYDNQIHAGYHVTYAVVTDEHGAQMIKEREYFPDGGYKITWKSKTGSEVFTYSKDGRLLKYEDQYSDGPYWEYHYDSEGNCISRTLSDGTAKMEYDYQKIPTAHSAADFTDVKQSDYFYDAVDWAVKAEITNGTTPSTFSPAQGCTRAQAVTFLWRAKHCPEPKMTYSPFADVQDAKAYYYKAVLWAAENGITSGTSKETFSPDETCTRAQIVTFLWRLHGKPGIGSGTPAQFRDVRTNDYFYGAVLWASAAGVTQGTSADTFSPDKTCTRAQIVTFLYRDQVHP